MAEKKLPLEKFVENVNKKSVDRNGIRVRHAVAKRERRQRHSKSENKA